MFVMHGARTDEFYVSEYVRRKCTSNLSISLSFCYFFIFHSDLILLLSVSFVGCGSRYSILQHQDVMRNVDIDDSMRGFLLWSF